MALCHLRSDYAIVVGASPAGNRLASVAWLRCSGRVMLAALVRATLRSEAVCGMEIITGVERRRRWQLEEKLRIVVEVEQPGASFADVARRHEVSAIAPQLTEILPPVRARGRFAL